MKRRIVAAFMTFMVTLTALNGCSLGNKDVEEAIEYVTEEEGASDASSEEASEGDSIKVVKGLSEPEWEDVPSEAASASSTEASENSESSNEDDEIIMVFFGDSQFANGKSDGTDLPTLIGQRVPGSVVYNFGIGGTTATLEESTSTGNVEDITSNCFIGMAGALAGITDREAVLSSYPEMLEMMNQIDPAEVDYYFIEYGANDFFVEAPLDMTQYSGNKFHTVYEALSKGAGMLRNASPDAEIIMMTPFYGIYKDTDGTYIGDSYVVSNGIGTLAEYAQKVNNVVEDDGLIDFDAMFMTHCDLYLDTADQYLSDGLHLSLTGRQIFARLLAHIPNWIEEYEPYAYMNSDFINIAEFDPNEYYKLNDDMLKEYYPEAYEKYINGEYKLARPQE